jgi:hypothetical protein
MDMAPVTHENPADGGVQGLPHSAFSSDLLEFSLTDGPTAGQAFHLTAPFKKQVFV